MLLLLNAFLWFSYNRRCLLKRRALEKHFCIREPSFENSKISESFYALSHICFIKVRYANVMSLRTLQNFFLPVCAITAEAKDVELNAIHKLTHTTLWTKLWMLKTFTWILSFIQFAFFVITFTKKWFVF